MKQTVEFTLKRLARYAGEQGSRWDSQANLDRLNDVRALIYERGDYEGTMDWGCVKIEDCACSYLPQHLETIRQAWISDRPVLVHNQTYMSLDSVGRKSCCSCSSDTRRAVQATGIRRPITKTIETPYSLKADFMGIEDPCSKLIVRGRDHRGEKFEVTLTPENPTGGEIIKDITEVVKAASAAPIILFAVSQAGATTHLATYEADSVNPRFTQHRIINYVKGDCDVNLVILAKKVCTPLTSNSQLVEIESMQALRFAYKAMNALDGSKMQEYATMMQLMEEQLQEVDQNLSLHSGSVEGQPVYPSALGSREDDGWRI